MQQFAIDSWPTCEPGRTWKLTTETGTRNLRVWAESSGLHAEVTVVRRFLAALLLAACLLGIVQPALACASRSDCCQTGSTPGCGGATCEAPICDGSRSCWATRAIAPSSVSLRARSDQLQPHASDPPVAANVTLVASLFQDRPGWTPLPRVFATTVLDESLTYLRTARLRL